MDRWTRPTCAVCKKPVDAMRTWTDEARKDDVFEVYCHGQMEVTRLPLRMQAEASKIEFGFAFTTKELKL